MKKIGLYILAFGALSLASCEKELDQVPYNAIAVENAFEKPADFTNAIRGAYSGLKLSNYYGGQDAGSMIITPDILSDNLIINSQGRKSQQGFYMFNYTADGTWGMWYNAYATIRRANAILENADKLEEGDFKNNIVGQALALRALAHFDLLRTYAPRYKGATASTLGVPYVISTDANLLPARTPLPEAYKLVVKDFTDAIPKLALSNGVGLLDKAATEALLGRVYLYMEEWQKVVDLSTAAIADAPATRQLATAAQFPLIWRDGTEQEVLFKVRFIDEDRIPVGVGYGQSSGSSVRPEYSPTYDLFRLYTDTDIRKPVYFGQTVFNGQNFNYVKKYVGRATGLANVVDVKVIRLSEVYLNRAEAYYNLGKMTEALSDLNAIRSRRYTDFNAATAIETGQALYNAILLQRRLELAVEGHRFYDLKRLGLPIDRSDFGDRIDGTGVKPAVDGIDAGSNKFSLPIPQFEINTNPNIVQNPGY